MVASIGSYISGAGLILFLIILYVTFRHGKKCADNPWGEGATTLEWTISSPPPFHTFEKFQPRLTFFLFFQQNNQ